ncbi:MAG: hypothetical protein JNL96_27170 [Planctomycetaceae bacterium]|nr:hypothetical protein [Planctomycetaceae bacterium]
MKKSSSLFAICLGAIAIAGSTGCMFPLNTVTMPSLVLPWPVPVSPYHQDRMEDAYWTKERYERVPILGPVTSGGVPKALDPPTPDEVMRALEKASSVEGGVPMLWERQRNNVRMVIEPIADYVDPPRVYPMIGPAQLHHAHYKCTIYYTELTRVGWPIPHTTTDEDSREVIYIDHNHLHMAGDVCTEPEGSHPHTH